MTAPVAHGDDARLADVAVPAPLPRALTYVVPDALAGDVTAGRRVVCTLGSRRVVGVVMDVRRGEPPTRAKPVLEVLDGASLPDGLVSFLARLSSYYLAPIGEVVKLALPPLDRETVRAVTEPTLFSMERGERGVAPRKVQWVEAVEDGAVPEGADGVGKLRANALKLLTEIRTRGPLPLARLEETHGGARATVKRLEGSGLVRVAEREAPRDPFFAEPAPREEAPEPTGAQRDALAAIDEALSASAATTFLLHGVTGSGKTEVYLRAIARARELGKSSVMLVPEIALTPQLVARFRARFGDEVAVLHSGLTPRERYEMWQKLRTGAVDVAIGARSALFAPLESPGLIIVDEEHDPSFKQEEGVRYHARDMAIFRAHMGAGVCILGTATPSLESEQLVRSGKATRLSLPGRAREQELPPVEIVDLRRIGPGPSGDKRISLFLHRALEQTLAAGEQSILFLNRRGFAPSVRCEGCGEIRSCPQCSVALTHHKVRGGRLRCHYCEHEEPLPERCPKCHRGELTLEGLGTEKLEETLAATFPTARIARLDRDVASGKNVERVLSRVRAREVDILVGTQMVTKGHDLPFVTLVGVVNADAALSIPDFRAAERTFHLLVQVAGRAGRGDRKGRVLVQTYDPEHHAVRFAAKHDVEGFLERELVDRRELGYPPFSRLVLVRVDALDEGLARVAATQLADAARSRAVGSGVEVRGPAAAPIAKVRNRFRYRVLLRSASREGLRSVSLAVHAAMGALPSTVRVSLDVDPVGAL
ncbi:MAG: primosomal protein N' [Myxococcales bacterium]|nr:primosomal protein N' [Myxococcales bacterium]